MVVVHRATEDVLRRSTQRQREDHGLIEVMGVKGERAEAMASELGGRKCAHCHRLIFQGEVPKGRETVGSASGLTRKQST
jgi:hypothetical protein